jgi:hypothetical protein
MVTRSRTKALVATVLSIAIFAAGCTAERPTFAEWEAIWSEARSALPDYSGEPIPPGDCTDALATLRTLAPDLESVPDPALEGVVDQWLDIAEETMFECPPRQSGTASFEEAYEAMRVLELEVSAVLDQASD